MLKRFVNVILLLIATIIGGTVSYRIVEGWNWFDCLYMTVITITTTGYSEINEMRMGGRIVSMLLMLFGVGIFLYTVNVFITAVFETSSNRWERMAKKMKDHVIVCGLGVVGREVLKDLPKDRVVVIDSNLSKVNFAREMGFIAIHGDATDTATLEKAGVKRAAVLICCMSDANNAFASLAAKELNPNIKTIAILRSPEAEKKMKMAKVDILLSPYRDAARKITAIITESPSVEFVETIFSGNVSLKLEKIIADEEFAGKTLKELDLRRKMGCMVVAIVRNGEVIFPEADTKIELGDTLYMMCRGEPSD
uniref:Potassium channel protein n=1 Tax=Geoglobus ahangari TaxID=113653 RepID=A0A7C4S5H8_9EURY